MRAQIVSVNFLKRFSEIQRGDSNASNKYQEHRGNKNVYHNSPNCIV